VRFALFVGAIFAGNALTQAGGAAWLSWMSDLIPIERRGRYFGIRNAVIGVIGMAAGFAAPFFAAHMITNLRVTLATMAPGWTRF
jgi:hypothetical protein